MPRKLSDRVKIAKGTFRKDREAAPKSLADAQTAVATAVMELEAAKRAKGKTPRQKALAQDKVRVLNDRVELALEAMAKARAVPIGPVIRPGLAEMTDEEVRNADPPLSYEEELEYLFPKATIGKTTIKCRKTSIPDHLETIDRAMTTAELAQVLGVSRRSIFDLAKAGRIPSFRVGSSVRFDPHRVATWLRAR
jgi:excisionase family DNA binding protein